jgi:hypothetical protein
MLVRPIRYLPMIRPQIPPIPSREVWWILPALAILLYLPTLLFGGFICGDEK